MCGRMCVVGCVSSLYVCEQGHRAQRAHDSPPLPSPPLPSHSPPLPLPPLLSLPTRDIGYNEHMTDYPTIDQIPEADYQGLYLSTKLEKLINMTNTRRSAALDIVCECSVSA